ncbi:hypothetical protein MBANPS3_002156 [Mucor bainieri]
MTALKLPKDAQGYAGGSSYTQEFVSTAQPQHHRIYHNGDDNVANEHEHPAQGVMYQKSQGRTVCYDFPANINRAP